MGGGAGAAPVTQAASMSAAASAVTLPHSLVMGGIGRMIRSARASAATEAAPA